MLIDFEENNMNDNPGLESNVFKYKQLPCDLEW
jgi:hypothetical protein